MLHRKNVKNRAFDAEKIYCRYATKDISPKAINEMKRLAFHSAGNAQENRNIVREMKGRKKRTRNKSVPWKPTYKAIIAYAHYQYMIV